MSKSSKGYWKIQIIGWLIYGAIGLGISSIFYPPNLGVIALQISAASVMLFTSHTLRSIIKKYNWLEKGIKVSVPKLLLISPVFAVVANSIVTVIASFLGVMNLEEYSWPLFLVYCFQTFLFLALWLAGYIGVKYFQTSRNQEIEKWKLEAAVKDAELIALKAQINPHFLFNALNNIRGLILEDKMKARGMVDNLSELLRYSIQFNNKEKVTVKEEMEVVKKYVELEMVHHEDRLQFNSDVPTDLLNAKLPPMIIQLMTENAIKHGISLQKNGGTIGIILADKKDQLIIQVSNTGKLVENKHKGIGIKNAMERINLLFDKMPDFDLKESDGIVTATLKLPLQK